MKFLVCISLVLCACLVKARPAKNSKEDSTHYDQRQNGTENYRVSLDGVLLAVAPAESVISAISSADLSQLLDLVDYTEEGGAVISSSNKPSSTEASSNPPSAEVTASPKDHGDHGDKPKKGLRRRLASLLLPLLRRNRNE